MLVSVPTHPPLDRFSLDWKSVSAVYEAETVSSSGSIPADPKVGDKKKNILVFFTPKALKGVRSSQTPI